MNRIFRNALFVLAAGALAASCADYNETDGFAAQPDPTFAEPYKDLAPVKSYIDRNQYPNMTLGAMLKVSEFNRQELAHAAAVTNFDNVAFGTTLMSGTIVNAKGVMNFLDMSDLLTHVEEIGYEVYGSPIVANANQAEEWLATLTAPIEIPVDYVEGKTIDFSTMTKFEGTVEKGDKSKASIVSYEGQNVLQVGTRANVRIVEDFDVDPKATYTTTFWARAQTGKESVSFTVNFSGNQIAGPASEGKWTVKPDKWYKIVVEGQSAPDATEGFFRIDNGPNGVIYIQKVQVGYYPDNHRDQTQQELTDTIKYALNTWCDGLMKINAGRIQMFDLIDEPIETGAELENGMYDLKHSTEKIFWQDILGSENYAPAVAKAARDAYQRYEGDPAELKFFISESGLDDAKKMQSLKYWIGIWDANGAKIDGINAKLNLTYSEDAATQEANKATLDNLLTNLAATGKLIRLSNFDIKYLDADGASVSADKISETQRQNLADYYGYVIKSYMSKIPHEMQAGICKGNLADTTDPVGLWSVNKSKDWVRNATYKAFCDALSGK